MTPAAGAATTVWSSRSASALLVAAALAAPASAGAATPRVDAQLVTRAGKVYGPKEVAVKATRAAGCRLRAGLPIDVLAALRSAAGSPSFRARGGCDELYVFQVGSERERGAGGWVYKVGHRLPGISASAPGARLKGGEKVTWFWCVNASRCQRTLELSGVPARVAAGQELTVTVTAYDDRGRGVPAEGATVALGTARATADAHGHATLAAPGGATRLTATQKGLIPAFPVEVAGA